MTDKSFSIEEQKIVGKTDFLLERIDSLNTSIKNLKKCTVGHKQHNCSLYFFDIVLTNRKKAKDLKYAELKTISKDSRTDDHKLIVLKLQVGTFDLVSNIAIKVIALQETKTSVNIIATLVCYINNQDTNIIYINNN